jgi:hypothetical protein
MTDIRVLGDLWLPRGKYLIVGTTWGQVVLLVGLN